MGGRIVTRLIDLSNYTSKVHRRDAFFNDLWAETVIPLETRFPMLRTSSFTSGSNNGLLEKSLDLNEERRESVMVQLAYY